MVFNSIIFSIFFLVFMAAYLPLRGTVTVRNALILVASYVFYGWWDFRFLTLLALSTSVDFCAALGASGQRVTFEDKVKSAAFITGVAVIAYVLTGAEVWVVWLTLGISTAFLVGHALPTRLNETWNRRAWLALSLIVNFSVLFAFKYFNFFIEQAELLLGILGFGGSQFGLRIVLPVGLSFFTFQATSRTIDSYRGEFKPGRSLIDYAAFHAFFPQLVAGPIERAQHLMPQFETPRIVTRGMVYAGIQLFAWGLFKKMVLADNVAPLADKVYASGAGIASPGEAITAVLAFALQIYGDFSGYSDMARGIALMMGFELMRNFDLPYFSRSPAEFWRRWHISLSRWLRDYIYVPLGGSRHGVSATYRNVMVTMLLGGLWHGASWTFVAWGGFHGAIQVAFRALSIDRLLARDGPRSWADPALHVFFWLVTMVLVLIGWVMFRAQAADTAWMVIRQAALWRGDGGQLLVLLGFAWPVIVMECAERYAGKRDVYLTLPWFARFNVLLAVLLGVSLFGAPPGKQFIYFDF